MECKPSWEPLRERSQLDVYAPGLPLPCLRRSGESLLIPVLCLPPTTRLLTSQSLSLILEATLQIGASMARATQAQTPAVDFIPEGVPSWGWIPLAEDLTAGILSPCLYQRPVYDIFRAHLVKMWQVPHIFSHVSTTLSSRVSCSSRKFMLLECEHAP